MKGHSLIGMKMLTREVVVIDLKVLHVDHARPSTWQLTCMAGNQLNPGATMLLDQSKCNLKTAGGGTDENAQRITC